MNLSAFVNSPCKESRENEPDGFDAVIGEDRSGFSGGEILRIALAKCSDNPA